MYIYIYSLGHVTACTYSNLFPVHAGLCVFTHSTSCEAFIPGRYVTTEAFEDVEAGSNKNAFIIFDVYFVRVRTCRNLFLMVVVPYQVSELILIDRPPLLLLALYFDQSLCSYCRKPMDSNGFMFSKA